jgi:hypothetical protein
MASQPSGIVNRDHGRSQPGRALFYMIAPLQKAVSARILSHAIFACIKIINKTSHI